MRTKPEIQFKLKHTVADWLRHCVTSRNVPGSRCYKLQCPGIETKLSEYFLFNLPNASSYARPWSYSTSKGNERQEYKNNSVVLLSIILQTLSL
jgi:hypothetical protein